MKDHRVLRMERRFNATPEKVFAAWVEPAQFTSWFGPEGMSIPEHQIDPRVGGKWMTRMEGGGQSHTVSGVYRVIERPRRLVFTWAWHNEGKRGHESEVTIELRPDGKNGTLLTIMQQSLESAESLAQHEHGWTSTLNKLARHLEA
jgi:uncharacterized protein YndB with AHSA1/START domain